MILPLEKQLCSLEPARKLAELGVPQESLFWWRLDIVDGVWYASNWEGLKEHAHYSAYTCAELGEMLPFKIDLKDLSYFLKLDKNAEGHGWDISYQYRQESIDSIRVPEGALFTADTEADARAKMLIYLIEQGLVDVKLLGNKEI